MDVFVASSLNMLIDSNDKESFFAALTTVELFKFRNDIRNEYQTIIVGANTIKKDNPCLLNGNKNNIRIVIDKNNDLDLDSRIFNICPQQTYIISSGNDSSYEHNLKQKGVKVISCNINNANILQSTIKDISRGNTLVEGGAKTIGTFLNFKMVENLMIVIFPAILPLESSTSLFSSFKDYYDLKFQVAKIIDNNFLFLKYRITY